MKTLDIILTLFFLIGGAILYIYSLIETANSKGKQIYPITVTFFALAGIIFLTNSIVELILKLLKP